MMVGDRTPVRWDRLRRTVMVYTTWQVMSGSGVGIFLAATGIPIQERSKQTPRDQRPGAIVCGAAVRGCSTPTSPGAPIGVPTHRRSPAPSLAFGVRGDNEIIHFGFMGLQPAVPTGAPTSWSAYDGQIYHCRSNAPVRIDRPKPSATRRSALRHSGECR